jgi:hypothetical protein
MYNLDMFPEQPVPKDVNEIKNQSATPSLAPSAAVQQPTPAQPTATPIIESKPTEPVYTAVSTQADVSSTPTPAVVTEVSANQTPVSAPVTPTPVETPTPQPVEPISTPVVPTTTPITTMPPTPSPEPVISSMPPVGNSVPSPQVSIPVAPTPVEATPAKSFFGKAQSTQNAVDSSIVAKKSKFNVIGFVIKIFLFFVVIVPLITAGLVAAVSYDYISIGNPLLQKKIQKMVFSLPYFPKPAKYILSSALENQKNIKSGAIDLILNISNIKELTNNSLAVKDDRVFISGTYTSKNSAEQKFDASLNLFGISEVKAVNDGNNLYLNPQSLPDELYKGLQLVDQKEKENFLNQWVNLGGQQPFEFPFSSETSQEYLTLLEPSLLKLATMTEDADTYKFALHIDKAKFQEMFTYLEEYYKKQGEEVKSIDVRNVYEKYKNTEDTDIQLVVNKYDLVIKNIMFNLKKSFESPAEGFFSGPLSSLLTFPGGSNVADLKVDLTQKDVNKDYDISTPENTVSYEQYMKRVTESSPMFALETAKLEYTSILLALESFKQEMLAYYLQNSQYPDSLDPLPSVDRYKKLEADKLLFYRKLDLTHWGMFVAVPDPVAIYPSLKDDTALLQNPSSSKEKPYMALIYLPNAADPQVQYYAASEIANIAPDVILRKVDEKPLQPITVPTPTEPTTPTEPVTPADPSTTTPPEDDTNCDSPFGCL